MTLSRGRLAIVLVLLALGSCGAAALAAGSTNRRRPRKHELVLVGKGVAGVQLGDPKGRVQALLGSPSRITAPYWNYAAGLGGRVELDYWGRVEDVATTSRLAWTTKHVGPGSSVTQFKRAYPRSRCSSIHRGAWRRICTIRSRLAGATIETDFLFKVRLAMIDIYAVGRPPSGSGMQ